MALDGLLIAASYSDCRSERLIQYFKYKYIVDLGEYLAEILIEYWQSAGLNLKFNDYCLAAVPLAKRRLLERGFNQADLLAIGFRQKSKLNYESNCLQRIVYTKKQMSLGRKDRLVNIKDAFLAGKQANIEGKSFLIIDDVATTTATLNECAEALKKSGAASVWGLVVARGE
jgi:ComF family protein